jgi:hypothetical protein
MSTTELTALIARFDDPAEAVRFVRALRREGYRRHEVNFLSPRNELLTQQMMVAARFGALAGLIIGLFAGIYLTGEWRDHHALLEGNRFLGIFYTCVCCALGGFLAGALVGGLASPAQTGAEGAATETLVVVQCSDPQLQERAVEILEHLKQGAP